MCELCGIGEAPEKPNKSGAARRDSPLNILTEEAERCCLRAFRKLDQNTAESFACPKCGQEYVAETRGDIRYWQARVYVVKL